jgi:rod shape determining protein RodA
MNKSWFKNIDYVLLLIVFVLALYGLIIIYSANFQDPGGEGEFNRQVNYFFAGLILLAVFAMIDYKTLVKLEIYLYIASVLILLLVIFIGHSALGAQRWISIGSFSFQPSEFVKITLIIFLSSRLSRENALKFEEIAGTFLYVGITLILILIQPDLGTALVLVAIFFAMLFIRGFNPLYIGSVALAGAAVLPFVLKEYQKQRLLTFLDPEKDPTGAGWNIIQSMTSVGSGRFLGRGLMQGTLTQLSFVPEHSTDFIFAVLGEELGFLGGASLILLYFFLLWKIFRVAKRAKDMPGVLMSVGIFAMFFFHIFVNIGMTIGVMPVTGVPLPFMSYGGSSLLTNLISVGILLSIFARKERFFKETRF